MNILIEDVNEFAIFLIENGLTADQFFFCALLSSEAEGYYGLPDRQKAISKFFEYYNTVGKHKENPVWAKQDLDELVEKGFIQRIGNTDEDNYEYQNFEVTEKFLDLVFEEKGSAMDQFQEFWDAYPARHVTDDGQSLNIKAVNKEEIYDVWRNAVKDVDHEDLLKALKIADSKNEVDCRIDKWLNSHQWEAYMDEVEEDVDPEDNPDIEQTVL